MIRQNLTRSFRWCSKDIEDMFKIERLGLCSLEY